MSAQYKSEYTQPTVGGPGCGYTSLGCYLGSNPTMPALKPGTTSGVYVTPDYAAIGYNALTHGQAGSCGGYFNIQGAYGAGAGNCSTSYTTRLCNAGCGGGGFPTQGWKCDTSQTPAKCVGGQFPSGTQGVFKTSYQCQANCK